MRAWPRITSCRKWGGETRGATPNAARLSQIKAMTLRLAAVSPWIYRCVVAREEWPASSWISRNEPPASVIFFAAAVMNVRRPE